MKTIDLPHVNDKLYDLMLYQVQLPMSAGIKRKTLQAQIALLVDVNSTTKEHGHIIPKTSKHDITTVFSRSQASQKYGS